MRDFKTEDEVADNMSTCDDSSEEFAIINETPTPSTDDNKSSSSDDNNATDSKNLIKALHHKPIDTDDFMNSLKKKSLYDSNIMKHANDKNGYTLTSQYDNLKDGDDIKEKDEIYNSPKKGCCSCCGPNVKLFFGIVSLLIGMLTFFYTPFDFILWERLRMTPGLPAFDWWKNPPDNIFSKLYIFNITNHEAFLNGSDDILRFEEVGPIVFKEMLEHTNVTFNDNGTLTYTSRRWPVFLKEYNTHIDMNSTIYYANTLVLGMASHINDKQFAKLLFSTFRTSKSPVIVKNTLHNYLWNVTDPMLGRVRTIAQGLIPTENLGIMYMMYKDMVDETTVYIGPKWGDQKFFTIDKFRGSEKIPGFDDGECPDTIYNATEGLLYSQRLTRETDLYYWRKSLCRIVKLAYTEDIVLRGVTAYKFSVPINAYHHKNASDGIDCYRGNPPLAHGLSGLSQCYYGLPVATSHPHFGGVSKDAFPRITGMNVDWTKHSAYSIVEPTTGIPLESAARAQINLVMKKLTGYSRDIQRMSEMTLPIFWMEISEFTLPEYVWALVIFMVRVVPCLQAIFSLTLVLVGIYVIGKRIKKVYKNDRSFYKRRQLNNKTKK